MTPSHKGTIPNLPNISTINKTCQTCKDSSGPELLHAGKLCDDNCLAVCDVKKCILYKDNKPVLKSLRCPTTGMHATDINNPMLTSPKLHLAHANLQQHASTERILFLHSALGFPPMSSLLRAIIAVYLLSFPDLTPQNVNKISTPDITVQGHMDQIRKNYQSTKPKLDEDEWTLTLKSHVPTKTNDFYIKF